MRSRDVALLRAVVQMLSPEAVIAGPDPGSSVVYHALRGMPAAALPLAWLASESAVARKHLVRYGRRLAETQTELSGTDLEEMGLPPGPAYGRILRALLEARLEGRAISREDELALAARLVAEEQQGVAGRPGDV